MISMEVMVAVGLAFAGMTGAWVKSVEERINQHEVVIAKLNQLLDLMLEDRLGPNNVQTWRHTTTAMDRSRD